MQEKKTARERTPIQLSDHFDFKKLIRFVMPSIIMMIFTSIYCVVDGIFVVNFAGKTPFAAINLIFPLIMIVGAFGFMIGAGGTAIVSKTLGMGNKERANEYFSLLVYTTVIVGVVVGALGIASARKVSELLGAEGDMLRYCTIYARIVLTALPFFMLQNVFQSFFIAAEKPKLGLFVTVAAGCTNIVLDAVLVGVLKLGLEGAAMATALSQTVGGVVPLIYFSRKNTSLLKLGRTKPYMRTLLSACVNGSSELMSNISASIVTMLYNAQFMKLVGEDGVAAYGTIMYVSFFFVSIFIGFSIGSAPIIGFHYGADNRSELKNLRRKGFAVVGITGVAMCLLALLIAKPTCVIFSGSDGALYEMTLRGFIIFSFSYLFSGINIFGSAFFTALNNGIVSAIISFLRTLVFQCAFVTILPIFWGLDGVWFSIIVAEALAFAVTVLFVIAKRKKYGY